MTQLASNIAAQSTEHQQNRKMMEHIIDDFKAKLKDIEQGGSENARAKHLSRGKMLPVIASKTLLTQARLF